MNLNAYSYRRTDADRFYIYEFPAEKGFKWDENRSPEYWEYRRRWTEDPKSFVVNAFPLHIDLELTSRCNLKCKFCKRTRMDEEKKIENGDMDWALVQRLLDEGQGQVKAVKFNIRGEPLLYPRLADAVACAKRRGVVETMINTNGMLLSKDKARELLDAGLDTIIFSLDWPDRKRYEANRVGASYEKIVRVIHEVAELKAEKSLYHVKLRANTLFGADIDTELKAVAEAAGHALNEVLISRPNPTVENTGIDLDACSTHFDPMAWQCLQPWQRLSVFFDGATTLCCSDFEGTLNLGNAVTSSLSNLWRSAKADGVRKLHAIGQGYRIPTCAVCHNFIHQVIQYYSKSLGEPYPVVKNQNGRPRLNGMDGKIYTGTGT